MQKTKQVRVGLLIAVLALAVTGLSGCPKGAYHDAVVIEHDFKETVKAFQQGEIALHNQQKIPQDVHISIEASVEKIATGGKTLTVALQKGADSATVAADLSILIGTVKDLQTQGLLGVKDETAKAVLDTSLLAVQGVLDNLQTVLAQPGATTPKGVQ